MKTLQRVHGRVGIRMWTRSINFVVNEIQRVWMEIANARRVGLDYLLSRNEVIKNGLVAWMTTHSLNRASLEFYGSEDDNIAFERWDMTFVYDTGGEGENYQTHLRRVLDLAHQVGELPPGARYRVVVDLAPGAVEVPGWSSTTYRDVSQLHRQDVGGVIDTSRIGVQMEYYGRL